MSELEQKFWSKVQTGAPDQCWPWLAHCSTTGLPYGQFWDGERHQYAHRMAFFFTYGHMPTPQGLHTCDNPSCCNPAHTVEGTSADNVADMIAKGRQVVRQGSQVHNAKLDEKKVSWIRELAAAGRPHRALAREFNVSTCLIRDVVAYKSWKHVK
jgi:hypothetical protein